MSTGQATTESSEAPGRRLLGLSPVGRVYLLSSTLVVIAAILLLNTDQSGSYRPGSWWIAGLVAVGFVLAERFVYHVEYRREAVSFSMSDVPAALALIFLTPVVAVAIRTVASTATIRAAWKMPTFKLVFNASLFAFDMALVFAVVNALTEPGETDPIRFLLVVGLMLMVSTFIGTMLVALVISFFEGQLPTLLMSEARTGVMVNPMVTMVACFAAAPALFRIELLAVAAIPVAAGWTVIKRFGQLGQNYRDLQAVHGFSGLVGASLQLDEIATTSVTEAMRLMRARRGAIQIFDANGDIHVTKMIDFAGRLPTKRSDHQWQEVLTSDRVVHYSIDDAGQVDVGQHQHGCLAVPILDAEGHLGFMYLGDREGASEKFADVELSRASTLGRQTATSVRRALLHATMEHAALHDVLTGEFNRTAFEAAVNDVLSSPVQDHVAVLMLDLNRFKEVNDTLGHEVGDRVLIEFARRLGAALGPDDVLARFGSDEFAILKRCDGSDEIQAFADQVLADSFEPMSLDGLDVVVATSIGIAPIAPKGATTAEALRQADIAMYAAKRDRTGVETYREEIDRRTPARLALLGSLRTALEAHDLQVHYQPKVDIVTSTIIGAEALARWHHPTHGWVSPIDFIQVAEESGLIKQVTDQVLTAAVRTVRGWHEAGHDLSVAVNLSTHDLLDEQLPQRIATLLDRYDVPAASLTLEITESALLADTPRTRNTIDRLDELGVRMSLDDFGTGYSSLGYLRRLPVSELKVDQSFVKNLLLDEQDAVIVKSTIDLGHNLGLQVVAEGIENEPVMARLRELGCDIGQGYGISRPLAPDLFGTWLASTEYAVSGRNSQIWH